jgi:hypothetical protein
MLLCVFLKTGKKSILYKIYVVKYRQFELYLHGTVLGGFLVGHAPAGTMRFDDVDFPLYVQGLHTNNFCMDPYIWESVL